MHCVRVSGVCTVYVSVVCTVYVLLGCALCTCQCTVYVSVVVLEVTFGWAHSNCYFPRCVCVCVSVCVQVSASVMDVRQVSASVSVKNTV